MTPNRAPAAAILMRVVLAAPDENLTHAGPLARGQLRLRRCWFGRPGDNGRFVGDGVAAGAEAVTAAGGSLADSAALGAGSRQDVGRAQLRLGGAGRLFAGWRAVAFAARAAASMSAVDFCARGSRSGFRRRGFVPRWLGCARRLAAPCIRAISKGESFFSPAGGLAAAAFGAAARLASAFLPSAAGSGLGTTFRLCVSMSYQPMLFQALNSPKPDRSC